jgi:hypothetical protein
MSANTKEDDTLLFEQRERQLSVCCCSWDVFMMKHVHYVHDERASRDRSLAPHWQ